MIITTLVLNVTNLPETQYYSRVLLVTCDHLLQYCAPNKTGIKKAVLIEYAFHFVAGDLYPLATDVELAKFRDSDPQGRLTVKTEPARRVRPELYIRGGPKTGRAAAKT